MKFLKIFISIIFFSIFLKNSYSEIKIDVDHIILQDHHSGQILFEREADEKMKIKNIILKSLILILIYVWNFKS